MITNNLHQDCEQRRKTKSVTRSAILLGIAISFLAASAQAQIISFNFNGGDGTGQPGMAAADTAGVVQAQNWNNLNFNAVNNSFSFVSASLSSGSVLDSTGTAVSGVAASASANSADGSSFVNTLAKENDYAMFGSYPRLSGALTFNVTGITGTYDAYIYFQGPPDTSNYRYLFGTVNSTSYGVAGSYSIANFNASPQVLGTASTFTDGSGYDVATPGTTENYLLFTGLTGNLSVSLDGIGQDGGKRLQYSGLQIVSVPEPGSIALLGIGLGLMVITRRRTRQA